MNNHPSEKLDEAKRRALFLAASAEFTEKGFERASLNRIIAEVGMSKSSFYHFFANKTDLFKCVLEQATAPMLNAQAQMDLSALSADAFWPTVRSVTTEMAHMINRSPEMVMAGRMFYRALDNPEDRALTEEVMAAILDWIQALMARGQDLGLVRNDLPKSLAMDMLMGLGTAMDRWMLRHWDDYSEDERLALNEKGFEIFRRMMQP